GQKGLIAFRALVDRLIYAFESATGDRATVTLDHANEMYRGQFLNFMRAVVSMMRDLFSSISYPTSGLAVDVFVYKRVTSSRRKSQKRAKRKRGLTRGLRLVQTPNVEPRQQGQQGRQKTDIAG